MLLPDWRDKLNGDPIPWLLEHDEDQPAIRYYTLHDILDRNETDPEVKAAKAAIMKTGPVPVILDGDWDAPGYRFSPKYRRPEYQIINLAQLGADGADPRIRDRCETLLSGYTDTDGGLSFTGNPSDYRCCTAGILGATLLDFGWLKDQRLHKAMERLAQTIIGSRVSGRGSSGFSCTLNGDLPCAWGAIKAMLALSRIPPLQRSHTMNKAVETGMNFLLSHDPAIADYPFSRGDKPGPRWFTFFYPLGTSADVLQNLEVLIALGQAQDHRLTNALALVLGKQDRQGRWPMEHTYVGVGEKRGRPSKWITLRALRVLKAAYPETE